MHGSAFFFFCGIVHIRVLDGHVSFFFFLSFFVNSVLLSFLCTFIPAAIAGKGERQNDTSWWMCGFSLV